MEQRTDWQVDEGRRLLRHILSRRGFVEAGLVAGIGALGLAGCGSGSGATTPVVPPPPPPPPPPPGTIPDGLTAVTGTISLPAGSSLKLTDLSVDIMAQTVPVSATAGFTVGISPSGPSLALLVDAGGTGVLMAMFDPSASSRAISAHTTAVALLYYATSAYLFPASALSQVLALLDGDPAMAALASAIGQAVAADPHALMNNAPTIGPAIVQAVQAIVGTSLREAPGAPSAARRSDPVPTLMLLTPTDAQNGVMVSQDATTTSLLISNTKRRPCRVYVYETTTLTGNVTTDVNPATLVAGPFDLDSTENLGLFTALKDFTTFFHGMSPWSPVNLAPVPLSLAPATADRTTYVVVVLASAFQTLALDAFEPAIFRDPHFAPFVATWRSDEKWLLALTIFGDVCLPIMCFLLGVGTIQASRSVIAGVVAAGAAAYTATFNRVLNQLQYGSVGQLREGLAAIVQDAIRTGDSYRFWTTEVQQVIGKIEAKALAAQNAAQAATRLSKASQLFLNVMQPLLLVGAILEGVDLGAVLLDFAGSDMADSWTALLIRQKLNLAPQSPRVASGDRVSFTVSNPANTPGGTFQYDWTQSSPLATLSAVGEANVGNQITTAKLAVDLITTGSDVTPIDVLVIGYNTSTGQRVEIGRAGTTVNFLYPAEILPSGAVLDVNEQRTYSVVVTGQLPNTGVQYRWTLTGTSGSIGPSSVVTTTVPTVNYIAATPGADSLHVDVLDAAGTLYAKADAPITVAAAASIHLVIAGTWDRSTTPANGTYDYTDFFGGRGASPFGTGLDAAFLEYDIGTDQTIGILLGLFVTAGAAFAVGEIFTKVAADSAPVAGQFNILMATSLSNPEDPASSQAVPVGPGTCTITALGQLLDGTWVANYSFSITNGGSGTITGSGVGRWK